MSPPPQLKTYSHLAGARRLPSEYEIVTSRLLYHPARGFEVEVPFAAWYARHQQGSPLACSDWERFADPRATTYTRYVALQAEQETQVDGLLRSIEETGYDGALPAGACALLARALAPLRFAFHGLQMVAAYVGQMAPAGRVAVAALLQAADELRRVQRVAYRTAQLRGARAELGGVAEESRALWQEDAAWQPLRRLVERLLVTYEWGEALVAVNLAVKPLFDELTMIELGAAARAAGDYLTGEILLSLDRDCRWHRAWSAALIATAVEDRAENRAPLGAWLAAWLEPAREAVAALAGLLGDGGAAAYQRADARAAAFRASLPIEAAP